ncbi:unnamed protein product [Zymoseptoria tritici ST99CH_1A5]|uniref:Uncharacterized protein n=1 Tax=Zymoseptoria tritici ST99CH_1A5 TaxID=1276529 RepID=A0A1Y6LSH7_ZYMTR|nr:unnamed protein product [Zymoseptoria tritici ST99CH_1A5]
MADPNQAGPPHYGFSIRPRTSPSPRNPRISTHSSDADEIDRMLAKYGHKIWGFVIYRSTYASDSDWAECLRTFRSELEFDLEFLGGLDILDSNPFTVLEDRDLFDGASAAVVRDHFNAWALAAPEREQGTGAGGWGGSPRYNFCVQIDERCLRSILDGNHGGAQSEGFIKLIRGSWQPDPRADRLRASDPVQNLPAYDDVDGCTAYDIGWAKIRQEKYLAFFCALQNQNFWQSGYKRPPLVSSTDAI